MLDAPAKLQRRSRATPTFARTGPNGRRMDLARNRATEVRNLDGEAAKMVFLAMLVAKDWSRKPSDATTT